MIAAYKEHFQFIMIMSIMYVTGVWGGPLIYPMFPLVMILFGVRERYFELFITTLWLLILADYVPVQNATHDDLQFAKDLKFMTPLFLFGFFVIRRIDFKPYPKTIMLFIPFFIVVLIGLNYSLDFKVGVQKTISFILMYVCVPLYVVYLHRTQGERFWKALITFMVGMMTIGIVLRFANPSIAMLDGTRFKGVLGNPNGLGIFLNLTFMLWITISELKLAKFTKGENWTIFLVLFISVLWSGSRNGMMSMFVFYMVHRLVKINWFLAVIAVATIIVFSDELFELFINIIQFLNLEDYFRIESIEEGSGRKIAWVFAWQEIQNYYFVGGGFGHDEHVMRPNYYWMSRLGHQGGVHNSYLSMWFDSGIIGLIAYFFAFIFNIIKAMSKNYLALAFGVSIMFNITYESWLVGSLNPFTIVFLVILSIFVSNLTGEDYKSEEEKEEETIATAGT